MSQRGRKSRASLSVVPVIPGARTPAPVELDEAESRIWDAVLRSITADFGRLQPLRKGLEMVKRGFLEGILGSNSQFRVDLADTTAG